MCGLSLITRLQPEGRSWIFFGCVFIFIDTCSGTIVNSEEVRAPVGTGPVFIIEPPLEVSLSIRNPRRVIDCLVHGDPEPEVTWHRQSGQKLNLQINEHRGSLVLLPNNSLMIEMDVAFRRADLSQASIYTCRARNRYGIIISRPVRINAVVETQEYSTQVYDEYVIAGNIAMLTCHFPSYISDYVQVIAWIKDDQLKITENSRQTGEKYFLGSHGKLYITSVTADDSRSVYKCETKHRISGEIVVTSRETAGRLHVTSPSSGVPPTIVNSIQKVEVLKGQTTMIPCVAHGHPAPKYRWCRFEERSDSCTPIKSSKRLKIKSGIVLIDAQEGDSGSYICKAENNMGRVQAATTLAVYSSISAFIHPQIQIVDIGQAIKMTCVISGYPIKSVKWFKDGQLIQSEENAENVSSSVLNLEKVNVTTQGMYQCFVGNDMELKQAIGQLILSAIPPKFTKTFQSKIMRPDSRINLECSASGDPLPVLQWSINGLPLKDDPRIRVEQRTHKGVSTTELTIDGLKTSDGGTYTCEARNKVSGISFKDTINVYGPPFVWPMANKTAIAGDQVILDCFVSGYPIKVVKWYKDKYQIDMDERVSKHENRSLMITSSDKSDQGTYECRAQNDQGTKSANKGYLRVIEKPVIGTFPDEHILRHSQRLQFLCPVASGDPPIDFRWLFNGKNLPFDLKLVEADSVYSSTLSAPEVSSRHFGNYTCIAKNEAGEAIKSTVVYIKGPPEWTQKPASQEVFLSETVTVSCAGKGYPKPSVSWKYLSGHQEIDIPKNSVKSNVFVNVDDTLTIQTVQKQDLKTYKCRITNGIKPDLIQEITLKFRNPIIIFESLKNNIEIVEGKRASMKCSAKGSGLLNVKWSKGASQDAIVQSNRIRIITNAEMGSIESSLIIHKSSIKDAGLYSCKVSSSKTSNSTRIYLTVKGFGDAQDAFQEVIGKNSGMSSASGVEQSKRPFNGSSGATKQGFQLSGVTLLYIIPTTTAAVVLFIILIIVCVLLLGQRRRSKSSSMNHREVPSRGSTLSRKDLTRDEYMATLSKAGDRYEGQPYSRTSFDDSIYTSKMSTYSRAGSQIQPYATFTAENSRKLSDAATNNATMEMKRFE